MSRKLPYHEISIRINKTDQQLQSSNPDIDPEKLKIEMEELTNELMTQAEEAYREGNYEKVNCYFRLAKISNEYLGGNTNDTKN